MIWPMVMKWPSSEKKQITSWSKKNGTGHFGDEKQTNQRIDVKSEILTIQPIIQVVLKSYHHILKIVEMRAIWKKVVILEKQTLFNKTEMRTLEIKKRTHML